MGGSRQAQARRLRSKGAEHGATAIKRLYLFSMTGFIGQKSDAEDFVRLCALLRINVHLCATLAKFDHCCATLSDFVHSRALLIDFVRLCAGRP